jgi:hypothetical protein
MSPRLVWNKLRNLFLLNYLLNNLLTYLLTHSFTHSLTPWSRVLKKLSGLELVKKFPA